MATLTLPYNLTLRDYQIPLWEAMVIKNTKRSMIIWPRRNGKDLITLNILIAKAMQRVGLYQYVAPFYAQIRNIIWEGADDQGRRFLDYIPQQLIKKKFESRMSVELINGSILRLGGSDNYDSLVGGNPVGIVFTEYSLHKPEVWHYLRPILTNNGGWALFNFTPRGLNFAWTMAQQIKTDPEWFFQHLTRDDTGFPLLEDIDRDRRTGMPESLIQQEYYTSFLASSEATLIPLDIIQPTLNRLLIEEDYKHEPRLVGVDPAYSAKGDKAIIVKRQGRLVHPLQKYQGVDNMKLADHVATIIREWKPHAVLIDSGRGEGVISRLGRLGFEDMVIPVNFGGGAYNNTLYLNKRAEIWCRMRDWFMLGSTSGNPPSLPDDTDLITGLSTPTFDVNEKGLIQLESKKHIRLRGAYVMDEPDALAVTFAEDIKGDHVPEGRYGHLMNELEAMEDDDYDPEAGYNPFNHLGGRDVY